MRVCRKNPAGQYHDWLMDGTCMFCGEHMSQQEFDEALRRTIERLP